MLDTKLHVGYVGYKLSYLIICNEYRRVSSSLRIIINSTHCIASCIVSL